VEKRKSVYAERREKTMMDRLDYYSLFGQTSCLIAYISCLISSNCCLLN
jgi:hypothetical protein